MKYYYHKLTERKFEHYAITDDDNHIVSLWVNYDTAMGEAKWQKRLIIENEKVAKTATEITEQEFNKAVFLIAL